MYCWPEKIKFITDAVFWNLHEHYILLQFTQVRNYLKNLLKDPSTIWLGLG
jgi:hypothetical protein